VATQKDKLIAEAMKLVERGQYERAVKVYLKVVADDEKDVRTWLKIGDLYAKLGRNHEAAETYQRVAQFYSDQGFYTKAIAVYKQILKLDPRMVEIHERLADLYKQMGILPDAMQQYEALAAFHLREGNPRAALEAMKQAVELDPQNVASRVKLAEAYSKEGLVREAIDAFAKAAEHLQEQGRDDDYMKVAERLLFHSPDNRPVSRQLARLYLERGDARRALPRLQVSFKADPRDADTLQLLAEAFDALGQGTKMVSVLKELARIHGENGDSQAREDVFRRILRLAPDDPDARVALATSPSPPADPDWPAAPDGSVRARAAAPPPAATTRSWPSPEPPPAMPPAATRTRTANEVAAPAPPSASDDEIERVLAESEVFIKYTLHAQALEHLDPLLATARDDVRVLEKRKTLLLLLGRREEAAVELQLLVERSAGTAREGEFLRELAAIDPTAIARERDVHAVRIETRPPLAPAAPVSPPPAAAPPVEDFEVELDELDSLDEISAPAIAFEESAIDEVATDGLGFDRADAALVAAPPDGTLDDEFPVVVESREEIAERSGGDLAPAIVEDRFGADLDLLQTTDPLAEEEVPVTAAAPEEVEETAAGGPRLSLDPEQVDNFDFSGFEDVTTGVEPLDPAMLEGEPLPVNGEAELPPEMAPEEPVSAAPQPVAEAEPAPAEVPLDPELEDDLSEADFYLQQGMTDEARELLDGLLARHPDHPMVLAKLADLRAADPAQADRLTEHGEMPTENVIVSSPEAVDASAPAKRKNLLEHGVTEDDVESHFDLGIAYKEMGLLDDAMAEFQLVMRDPARTVLCRQMLGLCCLAKGQTVDAIENFKQGLYADGITEQEQLALFYELGRAYERLADGREALYYYDRIVKRDPAYRDVQRRIAELRPAMAGAG
jgi:tetratricopeptide (TPR) repeat protein